MCTFFGVLKGVNISNQYTLSLCLKSKFLIPISHIAIIQNLVSDWMELNGPLNCTQGGRAFVKFESSGMFGGETKQVYGAVHNAKQEIVWILRGAWDSYLESVSPQTAIKVEGAVDIFGKEIANENVVAKLARWKEVWDGRPEDVRTEIQYCFTQFTIELNEPEDGVAPTDSRNRPDQRIHENGDWKKADRCKVEMVSYSASRIRILVV